MLDTRAITRLVYQPSQIVPKARHGAQIARPEMSLREVNRLLLVGVILPDNLYLQLYVKSESTKDRHLMESDDNDRSGHFDQH